MSRPVTIEGGPYRASFAPDYGGRMLSFDWRDGAGVWHHLMPPAGAPSYEGRASTAFPLVPFGGRLRNACLTWNGHAVRVPEYPPRSGLVLHGDGARRVWKVVDRDPAGMEMQLDWPSPGWPFAARVEMRFRLDGNGLHMSQSLAPADGCTPFALGWHPYLRADDTARLILTAARTAYLDAQGFPLPFRDGGPTAPLRRTRIRPTRIYALAEPTPCLTLLTGGKRISLKLSQGYRFVTVHAPAYSQCIAIEPQTTLISDDSFQSPVRDAAMSLSVSGTDQAHRV